MTSRLASAATRGLAVVRGLVPVSRRGVLAPPHHRAGGISAAAARPGAWSTTMPTRAHASAAVETPVAAAAAPSSTASSTSVAPSSSTSAAAPAKKNGTAIVMLNMGGPSTIPEVAPFLNRLFTDGDIITLGPLQPWLGPLIAKRRTPKIEKQYSEIGGSQIRKWTEVQGQAMCERLDKISPETAPHKFYVCFRYANPLTEDALKAMKADGMTRAIAFSQYPQWSCTTTGSSLNHLWRELARLGMERDFNWSLIDRWHEHPLFIAAVAKRIAMAMEKFPEAERDQVVIVFSAHSLPMRVVNRGDPYSQEVGATVGHVMQKLGYSNRYILAWQSQVGPLPWLGPQTGEVIQGFARQGHKHLLVVPIAFTSDHVETLFEIDIEYAHVAKEAGVTHFHRAPSLNDEPIIFDALADLVKTHLSSGELHSPQYPLTCTGCTNPICKSICNPIKPYTKLRDAHDPEGELAKANPVKQLQ